MKYQKITNYVKLTNEWVIGLPNGFTSFTNGNEIVIVDNDYDTVTAFVFQQASVNIKKGGWNVEQKFYTNEKRIDILVPQDEDEDEE